MKNRFELIVFDWDGTLINTIDWIVTCLQSAGVKHGFAAPDTQAAKDVIGLDIQNAVQALYPEADSPVQQGIIADYSQSYFSKQLSQNDFFPGVYQMLTRLKTAGYRMAVATGKTREGLNKALAATATEALFDITRCADETASKPNPLMLHEIMHHTGTPPAKTLMVGDSIHDLQMALNANIASIGVICGANSEESLRIYDPLLCLQQPAELLNIIN